jgi:transcriptional regulator with XRE-family HTH domain
MKEIRKRLKKLRKDLDLSQDAFGKKLCVTGATISRIESGEREATDAFIKLVSQTFSVREAWLRTGEGEMEESAPLSVAEQLARDHDLSPAKVVLLRAIERAFRELPEDEFQCIVDRMIDEMHALAARRASDEPPS